MPLVYELIFCLLYTTELLDKGILGSGHKILVKKGRCPKILILIDIVF